MANIIVATEEQIQEAVFNAVSKFFSGNQFYRNGQILHKGGLQNRKSRRT